MTTPQPVYTAPTTTDGDGPPRMGHPEKMRIRTAAFRITKLYPGVVGEILALELMAWEEFGYRLTGSSRILRLVDHALTAPLPTTAPPSFPTVTRPPYVTGDSHLR